MNIDLIKNKIEVLPSGCWQWKKSTNSAGYGQLTVNKTYWLAHRYALSCVQDVLPTDVVRHMCHNPKCCNPEHLKIGTHQDNWHDSAAVHIKAQEKLRATWEVDGVLYGTCREAVSKTGVSMNSIIKHTKNGVFDKNAYIKACYISRCKPRI